MTLVRRMNFKVLSLRSQDSTIHAPHIDTLMSKCSISTIANGNIIGTFSTILPSANSHLLILQALPYRIPI